MAGKIQKALCALVVAALVIPAAATAAEDQFYFLGKAISSMSPVPGATQVYLRWDAVEGELPAEITALRLMRNGEALAPDWPRGAIMPASEIEALYAGGDHRRRKLETITRLNELASESGERFTPSQFGQVLYDLLDPSNANGRFNPLWAFLGSRTDFNIARARYRGFIDTAPVAADGTNVVRYELLGIAAAGTVRLGYLEIDPASRPQALPATRFRQVRLSDWRCDLPESSKDHFTVMLDWASPGANNPTDRVAAQQYIAGFDLFRSTGNLDPADTEAPPRDIAALAAAASHDSRGRPQIDGLEMVNDALVIDAGAPSTDPEWLAAREYHRQLPGGDSLPTVAPHKVPIDPKWVEARDRLARAGLRPGDRRAYYLVPRDFTGAYGPAVAAIVDVPQMTRPPAPWNLRTFADETSSVTAGDPDAFTISWDEVDLDNYLKMYRGTRLFCNTAEATGSGILEYVPAGGNCATDPHNAVRLDVRDYRVYRFENFDMAGRFKDSDGDGVADSAETPDLDGNGRIDAFERSLGTQCDVLSRPPAAEDYLVYPRDGGSVELQRDRFTEPEPPNTARMRDTVPAGNKDGVYWYRFVSEAGTQLPVGRLSHMSAPQRGLFPDRSPPPPPNVSVTRPEVVPQGCAVETTPNVPWGFSETLSDGEKGTPFTVSCGSESLTVTEAQLSSPNTDQCLELVGMCKGQVANIDFPANNNTGGVACEASIPVDPNNSFCQSGEVRLVPNLVDSDTPVVPGDLVPGGPTVTVTPAGGGTCIAVFETIDGTSTRLGSTCDAGGLRFTPRAGQFCGYAVATDENNNISATVQFPCTITPVHPKAPSEPQLLAFDVDASQAHFTFRLPAERIAITMARLRHEPANGGDTTTVEAIPVIDDEPGVSISKVLPVAALQGSEDRFCLSLMSVGRDDGTGNAPSSAWSTERCAVRGASAADTPQYLPWPAVQGAREGAPLQAIMDRDYLPLQPLLTIDLGASSTLLQDGQSAGDCWLSLPEVPPVLRSEFPEYRCFNDGFVRFRDFVEPEIRFIVYRQQRVAAGPAGNWVQVSPLIEYVHFDREDVDFGLDSGPITVWTLNDPYVKVRPDTDNPGALRVWFVDQYPFRLHADAEGTQPLQWRYQAVYFDASHRPVKWRASEWFSGGTP